MKNKIFNLFTKENIEITNEEKKNIETLSKKIKGSKPIPEETYSQHRVKRGLRNSNGTGVPVGLTNIGGVTGYDLDNTGNKIPKEGKLYYRGYDIEDLVNAFIAENRFGFEEITYLLLMGSLPKKSELDKFKEMLSQKRKLPNNFARDMILTTPSNNIMNLLSRSILGLYAYDPMADDISVNNVLRQSINLIGYFPALVAYSYQAKRTYFNNDSLHLHYPIGTIGTAENILRMIRPTGDYTSLEATLLDLSLILHAEHGGGNNSSFTTHLVSSTGTDTYSAISAAIGSLKGPRHGGANIKVIHMIEDLKKNVKNIENKEQVEDYLVKVLKKTANDKSGLIYGMGHAIYTKSDPRAVLLKGMAEKLAVSKNLEEDFTLCKYIEEITPNIYKEINNTDKDICANVDLYSGFVYSALDIPSDIATPLFAAARLSGWCAHRLEELSINSKLMRPAYISVAENKEYVPIEKRKG